MKSYVYNNEKKKKKKKITMQHSYINYILNQGESCGR